jgi:hypothetical protein
MMGMKSLGIGGSFTFGVKRWVRGGNLSSNIQLGVDLANEGFNLGREVMFQGFHFFFYSRMNFFIDGSNMGNEFSKLLLGLYKIIGQGIETGFKFLAMGVGHDEGGNRKGESVTKMKRGYG